jgi:hypothetical protein
VRVGAWDAFGDDDGESAAAAGCALPLAVADLVELIEESLHLMRLRAPSLKTSTTGLIGWTT